MHEIIRQVYIELGKSNAIVAFKITSLEINPKIWHLNES